MNREKKFWRKIICIVLASVMAVTGGAFLYVNDYYHAEQAVFLALKMAC